MANKIENITPGEILEEEFLKPHGLSMNKLAQAIHVPANRISLIVRGQRAISADTALRLSRFFGTSENFWMNLQRDYELSEAKSAIDMKGIRKISA